MRLDKELEIVMGAKERAIGALRQHEREHRKSAWMLKRSAENTMAKGVFLRVLRFTAGLSHVLRRPHS